MPNRPSCIGDNVARLCNNWAILTFAALPAHAGAPPFLVIHGDKDSLCAVAEARRFAEVLGGVSGQAVGYAEIAGAQHAFDIFRSLRSELVMYGVERFLAFLYSRYLDEQA